MNVEHALDQMINQRRNYLIHRNTGHCDVCNRDDAHWLTTSIFDLKSECEDCFVKRVKKELTKPKLNVEDFSKL